MGFMRDTENFNKFNPFTVGKYDIPTLKSNDINLENFEFISFNYAKTCKDPTQKGIHFFIDDYQFQRLWTNIDNYINMLSKFEYVCTPDFSIFTDYPVAMQIYNHYRKQWIGSYLQSKGIKVIPTISWSDVESFKWCFDGVPKYGVIAISSIGTQKSNDAKEKFLSGYKKAMEILKPTQILFYGDVPKECIGNIVKIKSFQSKFKER